MKAIFIRRSVRNYTTQPVSDELITDLLKAAMAAPSAGNEQPWEFIVVRSRELLLSITQVHAYSQMLKESQAAIIVCADLKRKKYPLDYWVQDCAAATQNILLAAADLGLGTCWLGVYPDTERVEGFRRIFAVPEHIVPFSAIAVGYPANPQKAVDRFDQQHVHLEKW